MIRVNGETTRPMSRVTIYNGSMTVKPLQVVPLQWYKGTHVIGIVPYC